MKHPFSLTNRELDTRSAQRDSKSHVTPLQADEAEQVSGGLRLNLPGITTFAGHEEGGGTISIQPTTLRLGEEGGGGALTSYALHEEGGCCGPKGWW